MLLSVEALHLEIAEKEAVVPSKMVSALEAVMGRDAPHRVVPHPVTDLGMTQGKLHLSKPNVFHQGHCLKANLEIFVSQTIHQNDWSE